MGKDGVIVVMPMLASFSNYFNVYFFAAMDIQENRAMTGHSVRAVFCGFSSACGPHSQYVGHISLGVINSLSTIKKKNHILFILLHKVNENIINLKKYI